MQKTKLIISLLLVLFLTNSVMAVSFSPSSLTYNLKLNQQECKTITLGSDSETITISDSWAENKDVEWKVSLFDKTASEHGISINYPEELSLDEREVEVCLSGANLGEYHGVLLMKEEQQGNSIIQMGVWLKVIISNEPASSGSPGGSSSSSKTTNTSIVNTNASLKEIKAGGDIINNLSGLENENSNKITGSAIGALGKKLNENKISLAFAGLILALGLILLYNSKRRNKT
ncbi:MAG: hypothetical protein AABX30_02555 [Nanoarchaeota archaeon]